MATRSQSSDPSSKPWRTALTTAGRGSRDGSGQRGSHEGSRRHTASSTHELGVSDTSLRQLCIGEQYPTTLVHVADVPVMGAHGKVGADAYYYC